MKEAFPPFKMLSPQVLDRRPESRPVPLAPEALQKRKQTAERLIARVLPLSRALRGMSDAERRAVFYKLEHDLPISLAGLDLKAIATAGQTDRFTLAVPKDNNLEKLIQRIEAFGSGELKKGHAPHEQLIARIVDIQLGDPKDRLSQALYDEYDRLVRQKWVNCEVEMISLASRRSDRRMELQETLNALEQAFGSGVHGHIFQQEMIDGALRAVIRCTGSLFRALVEEEVWRTRIFGFDARPSFETFDSTLGNFSVEKLGPIESPAEAAAVVCIVDSGVTRGNPFLTPVTRADLLKSFLEKAPSNPNDEVGHGSGVASLASYYAINVAEGASNVGRIWIASARILDASNKIEEGALLSKLLEDVVGTFRPLGVQIFNLSVNAVNQRWNAGAKRTFARAVVGSEDDRPAVPRERCCVCGEYWEYRSRRGSGLRRGW